MYWFSEGWMYCGQHGGPLRMRVSPRPVCEKWRPNEQEWVPAEPLGLFLRASEDYCSKTRVHDPKQLELPMTGESNPLDTPPREDPGLPAYRMWLGTPAVYRKTLSNFSDQAWSVLCFLDQGQRPAAQLAFINPGLAWLLSEKYFHPGKEPSPEKAEALCGALGLKQRKLLLWLDLPDAPWLVHVLTKLSKDFSSFNFLSRLQALVQNPDSAKLLQHLPLINRRMFQVMRPENLSFLSYRFMMELQYVDQMELSLKMLQSLLRDASAHAAQGGDVPKFQSIRHLERWHWDTLGTEGLHSIEFPKPPFTGSKWIRPITHSHMLKREGKEMRHCVATYEKEILRGDVAIYVLLHPQRATLGLQKNPDQSWRIFDFRLPGNQRPGTESRRVVETWLSVVQGDAKT